MYAFIAVMVVFTIVFFSTAFKSSYAFPTGEETDSYDLRIKLICNGAKQYGEENPDLFANTDRISVSVNELVELRYVIPDEEDGTVKDPTSDVKTLNDLRIIIIKKDGEITTSVVQ